MTAGTQALSAPDGLVVFDGVCRLCSGGVRFLLRADRAERLSFTAAQWPFGRALLTDAGLDPDDPSTFLYFDQGRPLQRSDAVLAILRRLPAPWPWLARAASAVPRGGRDRLYDFVARRRYQVLGRRASCELPGPELRGRFIVEAWR